MYNNNWVFDEPGVCEKEPFVMGSSEIITNVAKKKGIKNLREKVLLLIFSDSPFQGANCKLFWDGESLNGNWYVNSETNEKGWLCPVLLYYFNKAPENIYFSVEEKINCY